MHFHELNLKYIYLICFSLIWKHINLAIIRHILKYACSRNQVNIYACVKRYTPATIWFSFISIFLYQIINIRYIPFASLYLVYLKHARIVYTCMCVLLSHVYKLCGSYLNTPAVVTRQIYTPVCRYENTLI
jgi:hypothetical protein